MSAEGVFDPEVYGEPVYTDNQSDTEIYGELGDDVSGVTTYNAFGQAQANILQIYQGYAQAQSDILQTYQAYAQCQAIIITGNRVFGQAQGDILAVNYVFAQAQSDIKAAYQGYAQCQADIVVTIQEFAQAQGDIKQTYNEFAQACANILTTSRVYGQCQAWIYITVNQFAQAQAEILEAPHKFGYSQAQADILIIVNNFAQVTSLIDSPIKVYSGNASTYILKSAGYANANAFIHRNEAQAQAQAQINHARNIASGQAIAIITKTRKHGQAQARIKVTSRAYAQVLAYIRLKATGQAQARISPATDKRFAQAGALITRSIVFAQARLWIKAENTKNFAQSNSKIKAIASKVYGQSQANIKAANRGYGQAVAFIKSGLTYGQALSSILTTSNRYGQALAHILGNTGYGQAKAFIDNGSVIIEDMLVDAHTYILDNYVGTAYVDFTTYTNEPTDPDGIYEDASDGTWSLRYDDPLTPAPNGWFYFTITQKSDVHFDTFEFNNYDHDTLIEVFTGGSGPGSWVFIDGNDDFWAYESSIDLILDAGTYLCLVGLYGSVVYDSINNNTPQYIEAHLNISIHPPQGYAQAQATINQPTPRQYGQVQAMLRVGGFGQARTCIKATSTRYGQAQAQIIKLAGYGQAGAFISKTIASGQAQATIHTYGINQTGQSQTHIIINPHKVAQAQARINGYYMIQAQAQALIASRFASGQVQAIIKYSYRAYGFANASVSNTKPSGQAQAYILAERYLISFNGYQLPGYAQEESIDSIMNIKTFGIPYMDTNFTEYIGLENKLASLRLTVIGENYLDCKNQIQLAATLLRTNNKSFAPLYVQYTDRHFEALTKSIKREATTKNIRTADYTIEFETKPWLVADEEITISGVSSITTTGRTIYDGGWTPVRLEISGTNVTISGYTVTGDYAGFVSISGAVTNFIINSDTYETTDNSVLLNQDYQLYVGPGVTNFQITGAIGCTITYRNKWYL